MIKFFVHTGKPYPVVMACDLFDHLGEMVLQLHPRCKVALLCDDDVDAEYGWPVSRSLESESYRPCRIPLPAGEACKAWAVLGDVLEKLAEEGFTRGDLLMALGGGVVVYFVMQKKAAKPKPHPDLDDEDEDDEGDQ